MQENQSLETDAIENPVEVVETQSDHPEDEFDYGPPRGTIAFLALMLAGYSVYYAWHYVDIFILRG